ncbi:unnamed protein product [Cladocopium goreaui]|uniref:Fibronectin type-III domain-containing protein n=1 Tax=Cladocopium goreaui TaxID=2562237 RepID=A0A9P1FZ99_9DINO|nr:unnamed protein product [Cladocopium goreaui]
MPPCPSPAGSVSPGMRQGEASADDCEGLTSMPSDSYADKLQALEEEFLMARRDRGDFDVRINRNSEQMDRLWQDFANERRERQVEVNEERMLRVAEMAELRERIDKLSKVAHFEPEGNCLNDPPVLETYIEETQEDQNGAPELTADGQGSKLVFDAKHAEAQKISGFSVANVANVANAAGASCDGSVCEVMSSDQSDQFSDIESIKGPTGREEELEELHVGMLQVSAGLLPRESTIEASELRKNTKKDVMPKVHESIFQWIEGDSIKSMLLPIATAILLPHAVSFLVAHAIMHKTAEHSTESEILQEKQEEPKSFAYIAERIGPMWLIHMLGIFSFALGAPSIEYLYLNYFARQQSHSQIDCSVQMAEAPCAQSIMKVLHLAIIRGFALPFVQFIVGPALGAFSDAYGRRPAVLVIRTCLFIHCAGTAAVAWFPIPIWIDFGLSFFAMIPWGSVPFAWYIDRLDHAPSIVYAMSMVEGSCIICAALGTAIGSFLTLKMALLVEFLGRGVTTMLIAIFLLPESLPEEKRVPFSWSSLTPTAALQLLLQSPVVEKLTAIGVINAFHWAGYYTLFGRFLQSHMAWTRQNTYTGGLVEQVSQVLWLFLGVKVLLRIFGQAGLMAVSTTAAVLSNILQMLSNKPWQIYTNSVVLSGPAIMGSAVVAGIVGKAASGGQQGMLQTALGLVTQMAGALGPVAFATVYKLLDPTAQLRRLVADAKRAEAMVRREVGRAIADARTYLEDTGHQQQEFWAARQRMAACRIGNADTTNPKMSEALSLHLDSEIKTRTRLEAMERGFNSVQKCVENLQSLPQQMEAYVNQEIEQVRTELKESLEERQKKRRLSEVEHSAVKQAIAEVRFDVVSLFQKEVKTLREEFGRARSDEAYRQSLRIHEVEERISAMEKCHVSTSSGDEAKSAFEGLKEGTGECSSALRTLRTENMQAKVEVRAEMQKMKQELDAVARRVADTSVANLADLDQRFNHVEEKLRLLDPKARSGARDAEANLHRLDDVLQEVEIMKKCLEELAQRFGQESQDGKGSMSPRSFRLQVQGSGQVPNSITTTPQNSYVPVATNSWVAPRVVVSSRTHRNCGAHPDRVLCFSTTMIHYIYIYVSFIYTVSFCRSDRRISLICSDSKK